MREFGDSLEEMLKYPMNLVHTDCYHHRLRSYHDRLVASEPKLCCDENKAQLCVWVCEEQGSGEITYPALLLTEQKQWPGLTIFMKSEFQSRSVSNVEDLGDIYKIGTNYRPGISDSRCQFA